MSHFTYMETSFQNLFYLEKSLNRLNITYKRDTLPSQLVVPQPNGHDVKFLWINENNKEEYKLVVDLDFWENDLPVQTYINNIRKEYARETIAGEIQKIGFQPIKQEQNNTDKSYTFVFERWNNDN